MFLVKHITLQNHGVVRPAVGMYIQPKEDFPRDSSLDFVSFLEPEVLCFPFNMFCNLLGLWTFMLKAFVVAKIKLP